MADKSPNIKSNIKFTDFKNFNSIPTDGINSDDFVSILFNDDFLKEFDMNRFIFYNQLQILQQNNPEIIQEIIKKYNSIKTTNVKADKIFRVISLLLKKNLPPVTKEQTIELNKYNQINEKLKEALTEKKRLESELEVAKKKSEETDGKYKETLKNLEEKINELKNTLLETSNNVSIITNEKNELEKNLEAIKNAKEAENSAQIEDLKKLEERIKELENTLLEEKEEKDRLTEKIESLILELEEALTKKKESDLKLNTDLKDKDRIIGELQKAAQLAAQEAQEKINKMNEESKNANLAEKDRIQKELESVKKNAKDYNDKIKDELDKIKEEKDIIQGELDKIKEEKDIIQGELDKSKEEAVNAAKEIEENIKRIQGELNISKNEAMRIQIELNKANEKAVNAENEAQKYKAIIDNELEVAKAENRKIKGELAKTLEEAKNAKDESTKKLGQYTSNAAKLAAESAAKLAEDKIKELELELGVAKIRLQTLENEKLDSQNKLLFLQYLNDDIKANINNYISLINSYKDYKLNAETNQGGSELSKAHVKIYVELIKNNTNDTNDTDKRKNLYIDNNNNFDIKNIQDIIDKIKNLIQTNRDVTRELLNNNVEDAKKLLEKLEKFLFNLIKINILISNDKIINTKNIKEERSTIIMYFYKAYRVLKYFQKKPEAKPIQSGGKYIDKLYENMEGDKKTKLSNNTFIEDDDIIKETKTVHKFKDEKKKQDIENPISLFMNKISNGINSVTKDDTNALENDVMNPFEAFEIKNDDRIVFIIITFIIRYISILLINWCIEIDTIKSFNEAFILFTFIYIIIFWFIVMIINVNMSQASEEENVIISSVKSILFYFYFKINGIERLMTHTLLILLLLTIPIIIKAEKKENDDEPLSYEDKIKLNNILSLFTIFMWIFTSIIAMKF